MLPSASPEDYGNDAVVLNFAGTAGETQQFTVPTLDDALLEAASETYTVNLTASNTAVGDSDTGTGTITDNDSASVTVDNVTETEGTGMLYTVTLDNEVAAGAFTVTVGFADVTATGGALLEAASETYTVNLTASNTAVGDSDTGTGTITDNDTVVPTITKSFAASDLASGDNTDLTVTIGNSNVGAITLTSIFTDTFPTGMTINTAGNTGSCAGVSALASATNFTIASGTSISSGGCTVVVNVTSSTEGTATNTIPAGALQTSSGNNAGPASDTINVYAKPIVTKSFTPTSISAGGTSSMVITVSNPAGNPGNLTGVSINDIYTGTLVNNAAGSVVCSGAGSATLTGGVNGDTTVGFNSGTIVPGGTCTITQSVSATSTNNNTTSAPSASGPVGLTGSAFGPVTLTVLPTISINDVAIAEGNSGTTSFTFDLTLSNSSAGTVTVDYATNDGTATEADSDYSAISTTTLTFLPGETSKNVTVNVTGDTTVESNETFTVDLTSPSGAFIADSQGVGTLNNDDSTAISINDIATAEGNAATTSFTFDVTLSNPSDGTVTVDYATNDGTATVADTDYSAISTTTLTFLPNETSKNVTVNVTGDTTVESNETFTVDLFNETGSDVSIADNQGQGTINNDDGTTISINDAAITEGDSGTTIFTFNVTLSNPSASTVTVDYATNDGTATVADTDYSAISTTTLTFLPGEISKNITVSTNGDTTVETDETFTVDLTSGTGATIADSQGVGTLNNDDSATISINDIAIAEGNSGTTSFTYAVSLSNPSAGTVTVDYATNDGTATAADSDYTAISATTLTFLPGETSKSVTVTVTGDTTVESNETFTLDLSNETGTDISIVDNQGQGTINNDDSTSISINDVSQAEGNSGITTYTFTVSLSNPSDSTITVDYATADGTATVADSDYTAVATTTLSFLPGDTSKDITVNVTGDTTSESNEIFTINLSNETGGVTLSDNQATATVVNDDNGGIVEGNVFHDLNYDNSITGGEEFIGIPVQLLAPGPDGMSGTSDDIILQTTTTDANGFYTFANVMESPVMVVVDQPNSTFRGSQRQVNVVPGGTVIANFPYIDPAGIVYDAVTGDPIENAVVNIYQDNNTNGVIDAGDFVAFTQVTAADGAYAWALAGIASYVIEVTPPNASYSFRSTLIPPSAAPDPLPGPAVNNPDGINTGVYYLAFRFIVGSGDLIGNDIPLDPPSSGSILLTKKASKKEVTIGDMVSYTVTAENTQSMLINNITLHDLIPAGFKYVDTSARLVRAGADGLINTSDDIKSSISVTGYRPLIFEPIDLAGNEKVQFRYLLRAGSGITQGEYINRATPYFNNNIIGNTAIESVVVIADPIFEKTTIIGKVFNDRDEDGWQDSADALDIYIKTDLIDISNTTIDFGDGARKAEENYISPEVGISVGSLPGRSSESDLPDNHQVIIRTTVNTAVLSDIIITTKEGTRLIIDEEGNIRAEHRGDKARGLTGQNIVVKRTINVEGKPIGTSTPPSATHHELVITITNHGIHEQGIPGVRLATPSGLLIETDSYGRYHIADVDGGRFERGRNFIIKVDSATLPQGALFTTENPRVLRITQGIMSKINFGIKLPAQALPEKEVKVNLGELFFEAGQSSIRSEYRPNIEKIASAIRVYRHGTIRVALENPREDLSLRRADSLRKALTELLGEEIMKNLKIILIDSSSKTESPDKIKDSGESGSVLPMIGDIFGMLGDIFIGTAHADEFPEKSRECQTAVCSGSNGYTMEIVDRDKNATGSDSSGNFTIKQRKIIETKTVKLKYIIEPLRFQSGNSRISETDKKSLITVIDGLSGKKNLRLHIIGHTDNKPVVKPRTRKLYKNNYGLSRARAEMAGEVLREAIQLPGEFMTYEGKGPNEPIADNDTPEGRAQNRRVEVEIWYDEIIVKVIEEKVPAEKRKVVENQPASMELRSRLRLPDGGVIWATQDPAIVDPRLDITATTNVMTRDGSLIKPVDFSIYSNYRSFIDHWELIITHATDTDFVKPLKVIKGNKISLADTVQWSGETDSDIRLSAGKELLYVLRVYDSEGHLDQTKPRRLYLVNEYDDTSITTKEQSGEGTFKGAEIYGESHLARQTIPIAGSRVRIHGSDIPEGYTLKVNDESVPLDSDGSFAVEHLLASGQHTFRVDIIDRRGAIWKRELSLDVTENYFFMVGIADLTVGENNISGSVEPVSVDDHFDEEVFVDGRLAFYLKGKIKGKYLVTAQMDTQEDELNNIFSNLHKKDPRAVFRRLDPDRFYPVYGDDSTTIQDTDSQGKFYVRVDWDKSQVLWGNYNTSLTGTELAAFASEAQTAFAHNELKATGGSLYYLKNTDLVQGSEKIWVEIRGRDTERVVENIPLVRGRDYEIDEIQGRIILSRPLTQIANQSGPSIIKDKPLDGNDVFLMVDYEYVPSGFDADKATYGARGKGWISDHIAIGGTYVHENRDNTDYELKGFDVTVKAGRGTYLKGEFAASDARQSNYAFTSSDGGLGFTDKNPITSSNDISGHAVSLEARMNLLEMSDNKYDGAVAAWWKERDDGFSISRLSDRYKTVEYGVEGHGNITDELSLSLRGTVLSQATVKREKALSLQADYRVGDKWTVSSEVRHTTEEPADENKVQGTLGALRLAYDITPHINVYGAGQLMLDKNEYYKNNKMATLGIRAKIIRKLFVSAEVSAGDRGSSVNLGADYAQSDTRTIYGTYTLSKDRTDGSRGIFTIGQRSAISNQLNVYTEHQYNHGDVQAGIAQVYGLDYALSKWTTLGISFQSSDTEGSTGDTERNVGTVSLNYKDDKTRSGTKLEYRHDSGQEEIQQWLTTNSINYQAYDWLTLLGKLNISNTDDRIDPDGDAQFIEADLGFAYRPVSDDRLNMLGKYTYLYDLGGPGQDDGDNLDEQSHVFSLEGIYDLGHSIEVGAKYAYKLGQIREERGDGDWYDTQVDYAAIIGRYYLHEKWDGLLKYQWLRVQEADDQRHGLIIGIYRRMNKYFKLGLGYNFTDFDDDLTDLDYRSHGWFINGVGQY